MKRVRRDEEYISIPPSIFSSNPQPSISTQVALWLSKTIKYAQDTKLKLLSNSTTFKRIDIEVEAKLGVVIDKVTKQRLRLPILSETVVNNECQEFQFDSTMTMDNHKSFNQFLNTLVNQDSKVKYVHLYEIDKFIPTRNVGTVRETVDEKTDLVVQRLLKQRVGDLEISIPESNLDFRISVNLEKVLDNDFKLDETPIKSRRKNRLSYTLHPFKVDLTQVYNVHDSHTVKTHEVELEFTKMDEFVEEITKDGPISKRSFEYVNAFLNNIRILANRGL